MARETIAISSFMLAFMLNVYNSPLATFEVIIVGRF